MDFERICFQLGIVFNSNAIVHEFHGDFVAELSEKVSVWCMT